jgi:pimeloyl-ACP methyl ester carboxylesterase
MRDKLLPLLVSTLAIVAEPAAAEAQGGGGRPRPTIVLVHGAFAESSSWNPVVAALQARGYDTLAVANPLRGLKSDADYVARVAASIPGDVVLVGHSYGGAVISGAAAAAKNVRALVFVAGYAPDAGESAVSISARFPEGTLGQALAPPLLQADGGKDLYILPARFHAQFAADVPKAEAAIMAATQRPVTEAALGEAAVGTPGWKTLPTWFIYGTRDLNIPASAHAFMARRAGARETIGVEGASHVVMLSHPETVVEMIERAAAAK